MEVPFINLRAQYQSIKAELDGAMASVFEGGQFIGGRFVEQFEADFAALHKAACCIGTGNGTDSILVALRTVGIKKGDEVIVPSFGWISASEMITLAGARPVFSEVLESGTIDPDRIEETLTTNTRGIIIQHLYGQPAHVHQVKKIAAKHDLFLIEDCAQAHLTSEFEVPVGTIGNAGTFSFYPTKNLGAYGDAGCILTNDPAFADQMRLFANHGGLNRHIQEGINSRLDPLQAAILQVKCRHLEEWTRRRIDLSIQYGELLSGINEITLPVVRPQTKHTFHQYVIRTRKREDLKNFLERNGIQTLIHYPRALHNLPAYRYLQLKPENFPVATLCQHEVLSLPLYPELSTDSVSYVCDTIKLFFNQ